MPRNSHCPLCASAHSSHYYEDSRRPYRHCPVCDLVFVPPGYYLSAALERAEYDKHLNEIDDPGYRRFLSRLTAPLLARLTSPASGLDFGCGPGPALAAMLREAGHGVTLYDPNYANDPAVLAHHYDFITATEVVEHLHQPGAELEQLWRQVVPGGYLGVMTKLVRNRDAFSAWHYKNDPTHVCFFSRTTWLWWAARQGAQLDFVANDALLLRKPPPQVSLPDSSIER